MFSLLTLQYMATWSSLRAIKTPRSRLYVMIALLRRMSECPTHRSHFYTFLRWMQRAALLYSELSAWYQTKWFCFYMFLVSRNAELCVFLTRRINAVLHIKGAHLEFRNGFGDACLNKWRTIVRPLSRKFIPQFTSYSSLGELLVNRKLYLT